MPKREHHITHVHLFHKTHLSAAHVSTTQFISPISILFYFFFLNNSLSTQCIQSSPQHTSLFSPSLPIQLPHLSITSSRHTHMPLPYSSIQSHPIHPNYTQLHPTTSKHTTLLLFLLVVAVVFFLFSCYLFFLVLFCSPPAQAHVFPFSPFTQYSRHPLRTYPHTHTLPHLRLHTLPTFPHHF